MEGTSQQSARQFKARVQCVELWRQYEEATITAWWREVPLNNRDFQKLQKTEAPLVAGWQFPNIFLGIKLVAGLSRRHMLKSLKFVSRSAALNWRDCPNLGPATASDVEAMFGGWNRKPILLVLADCHYCLLSDNYQTHSGAASFYH